jgi:hypothetical protein
LFHFQPVSDIQTNIFFFESLIFSGLSLFLSIWVGEGLPENHATGSIGSAIVRNIIGAVFNLRHHFSGTGAGKSVI